MKPSSKIARTFLNEIEEGTFFKNREEEAQTYSLTTLMEGWLNTKLINWDKKPIKKQRHLFKTIFIATLVSMILDISQLKMV